MSKMPAWSRSLHSVSLKVLASAADSGLAALKSGTASRTFSTPRPVPVRIQSWAAAGAASKKSITQRFTKVARRCTKVFGAPLWNLCAPLCGTCFLSPIVKIKLHGNSVAGIIAGQRPECINAFERVHGGVIERRHVARLLNLHVGGAAAAIN